MPACRLKGFACCCGGLGCPVDDRLRGLRDEWDLSTLACGWAVVRSRAQRVCDAEAEEAEGPPGTIGVFIPSYSLALAHDPLLCASTAHPFKGQDRGFEPDRPGQQYQRCSQGGKSVQQDVFLAMGLDSLITDFRSPRLNLSNWDVSTLMIAASPLRFQQPPPFASNTQRGSSAGRQEARCAGGRQHRGGGGAGGGRRHAHLASKRADCTGPLPAAAKGRPALPLRVRQVVLPVDLLRLDEAHRPGCYVPLGRTWLLA
ncbi:hypothetical protein ACK3TF_004715 [Chlorella vulgaris]